MREVEHDNLFKPPKGVRIIVIPVCGEFWPKGKTMVTPMTRYYASIAKTKLKGVATNLGIMQWHRGSTPHPLTCEENNRIRLPGKRAQGIKLPLRHHFVSLPTRPYDAVKIDIDYLVAQVRALTRLLDGSISWLAEGDVAIPQICDDPSFAEAKGHDWSHFKKYVEPWLADDRYVIISGKKGEPT